MPKRRLPPKDYAWTPELAYAVGLLVTDGNLSNDRRHISLRSAEPLMLKTFKKCLILNNKIGRSIKPNGNIAYRVQFGDVQFYDWLLRIGLFPNKSYTIGEIAVPNEFFRDYFRGCIDGDGSIQTYYDEYNAYKGRHYKTQRLFIILVSASEKHIKWLQNKIEFLTGVKGFITYRKSISENRVPIWGLKFAKKKSLALIEWMYYSPNVPCCNGKEK